MTTGKHSRFRSTALALSLVSSASLASTQNATPPARPATERGTGGISDSRPAAGEVDRGNQGLNLDVVLNSVPLRRLGFFMLVDGGVHATARTLRELGLAWPGEAEADDAGLVALDALAGVRHRYDEAGQRLYLDVPVSMLTAPPAAIGYRAPPPPRLDPATRATGLLFNYSLWARGDRDSRSVSSFQELRLFGLGPGIWRSSGLLSKHDGQGADGTEAVRLDTSWQLDFPGPMVSVVLGDTYSNGLEWTRSTRFGGVRVSRNFGLQPYRVTIPLASFAGEAALPSTVDLFIDGIRQARQDVLPGRFQIDSAPVLSGAGNAQVVITDITGQSRVVDFTVYNARQLLQRGLSDWSFEAGAVRRDYGLHSFRYAGHPMASASLRHGVSDALTLEAHAEATHGLEMGGLGAMLRLGRAGGVLSGSWARSTHDTGGDGSQYGFGYEWHGPRFSIGAATLRRDDAFRDVASLEGSMLPLRSDRAFVGLNFSRGQLGAGYVRQDLPGGDRARYATANWSQRLHRHMHLGLGLNHDLDGVTGTSAFAYLSVWMEDDRHGWVRARHGEGGEGVTVGAMRPRPFDAGGWGWRVQAGAGDDAGGQAEIGRSTHHGQWNVGALVWRGHGATSTTGYFDARGGLLWMQGGLFPMRHVFDAFALVSTDGIGDVPVKLENRLVGRTDARGLLLVTPLNAWQRNDLSIDPLVLPADVSVDHVRTQAVPATGSGMLVRFPMRAVLVVRTALRGAGGEPLPAGTPLELVSRDGVASRVNSVGYDGEVFLQDPASGAMLRATLADGQCLAALPLSLPSRGWVELGALACR